MQSYPNQQDHMYHRPHCYPGMETMPTQGHVNPFRPPMGYGCWPWGSSYGGAPPIASHGCCSHSYFPAQGVWGSPYSHVPTHHCPGKYPSFPVQYMPPPPYYTNMPGEQHCCGCLNHPLHHKEQKNVRIEEEEPERERRNDGSVVPYEFNNLPYPIAWLPPNHSGNEERGKAHQKNSPYPILWLPNDYSSNKEQGMAKKTGDVRNGSPDVKANENGKVAAQQPTFQNGWLPLDLNNLVFPKNKGDGEGNQQDDSKRNFPYPLFWMPYKHEEKEKEDQKEKDTTVKQSLESEANRESIGDRAATKTRDIPVKEAEQHVGKETPTNKEKERDASDVVDKENGEKKVDNGDKISSKEGSKKKSSPPPKSSKLPPVCLRVDPLPRRKNGDGSLWSSSLPSNKKKLDSQTNDASGVLNPSGKKDQAKILPNEPKEDKSTKIIKVVDGRTSQGNTMDVKIDNPGKDTAESQSDVSTNQYADNNAVTKGQSEDARLSREKNEEFQAQGMKADEVEKSCKTRLSEEEAAVMIQSAYRGFDVRRWEPIKKLKQIAKVREQITDVKHLIQAMKSFDIKGRRKQRNIVAETIMSLLIKLDTTQGLSPSIREVRKSVVRELVSLQEQLDSLMNEEPENSLGPESIMSHDEDALNRSEDVITPQKDYETTPTDILEAHQDQTGGGSYDGNSETSEAYLNGEQASEDMEKEVAASCTDKGVESAPEPTIEEDDERIIEKDQEDIVLGQGSGVPLEENSSSAKATDITAADHDTVGSGMTELPIGVIDDFYTEDGPYVLDEADVIGEQASEKTEKEATASCTDKGVESAPTIEEEMSNEVLVNDETIAEKDQEDLVLGQRSGIHLQGDSSTNATEIATTDHDRVGSELTELPIGVTDDFCAEVGPTDALVLAEADVADHEKQQLVGALIGSSIISEPRETADNKDSSQPLETHEVLDLPFNVDNVEPDSEETCPFERPLDDCKPDDKCATEEEVGVQTGDARVQHLRNFNTNMIGMPSHLLQVPSSKQETSPISESANFDEMGADAKFDEKRIASDRTRQGFAADARQPQITQASQLEQASVIVSEECNTKQPMPTETLEEQGLKKQGPDAIDLNSVTESNRRLGEENERLRDMMEKLIKSGQEQLLAISSLSGRVKDLEKKLSRKKKLKVKQYPAPRATSSCMTKYDDRRSVGAAM